MYFSVCDLERLQSDNHIIDEYWLIDLCLRFCICKEIRKYGLLCWYHLHRRHTRVTRKTWTLCSSVWPNCSKSLSRSWTHATSSTRRTKTERSNSRCPLHAHTRIAYTVARKIPIAFCWYALIRYGAVSTVVYRQWRRLHRARGDTCSPLLQMAGHGGHRE